MRRHAVDVVVVDGPRAAARSSIGDGRASAASPRRIASSAPAPSAGSRRWAGRGQRARGPSSRRNVDAAAPSRAATSAMPPRRRDADGPARRARPSSLMRSATSVAAGDVGAAALDEPTRRAGASGRAHHGPPSSGRAIDLRGGSRARGVRDRCPRPSEARYLACSSVRRVEVDAHARELEPRDLVVDVLRHDVDPLLELRRGSTMNSADSAWLAKLMSMTAAG